MSESKRANLIPFGGDHEGGKQPANVPAKSVRLAFVLPDSNDDTCPVYNFKEELKKRDKQRVTNGKNVPTNGLDPFDDNDDDVKRIAQRMEAKYGTGPPAKIRHTDRDDDYADIGMGYDESDSFIDNTDGYDEMVPKHVTTLHGGFYINCGALEFRADEPASSDLSSTTSSTSSSDEDDDEVEERDDGAKKTSHRKRVLESSDSDAETETDKVAEKAQHADKKHKKNPVTNMNGQLAKKKKTESSDANANAVKPAAKKVEEKKKAASKEPVKHFPAAVDSPESPPDAAALQVPATSSSEGENSREAVAASSATALPAPTAQNVPVVVLPTNLPDNIVELLNNIKKKARENEAANLKLISGDVKTLLITFERRSKVLGKQSRSKVYHHLAPSLKCKKDTLCRRVKSLVMDEDSKRLQHLLVELKAKVTLAMGSIQAHYDKECERVAEDPTKASRLPKRRFFWSEDTRKTFREILLVKKRLLLYEGKNKEAIEIHLNLFIKSDIQTIWPEGWMTMAALFKLSNSFDKKFTQSPSPQPPSAIVLPAKTLTTPSFTISPITSAVAAPRKAPKGNDLIIEPIPPQKCSKTTEKAAKFINLSHAETTAENLAVKPSKPHTDHKIENIMKPNPPKCSGDKDVAKTKACSEIIIPKEEKDGTLSTTERMLIPLEKFMPQPSCFPVKVEDDVIVLGDSSPETSASEQQRHHPQQLMSPPPNNDHKRAPKTKLKLKATATTKSASVGKSVGENNEKSFAAKKDAKSHEGDDIQKVMENLKVLQKMSAPAAKCGSEATSPSSAVSVIAFNKNYAKVAAPNATKTSSGAQEHVASAKTVADLNSMTFHDVYQRQFLSDLKTLAPTSSKNFSAHSSSSNSQAEKLFANANNNYTTQQNALKYKSYAQPTHSGSFNLMDDVLANFLTDYGYPKAASHKSKPPQK